MTQVSCDSPPGVRSHSWWMEGFLTLIPRILGLIVVLGPNLRLSVVLMMNVFFLIFFLQMPKMIRRRMDPPRLPLPQYDRHRKDCTAHGRRKMLNCAANSQLFTRNLVWKFSMIPSRSRIMSMISAMSAPDPPTFKWPLIRTFFNTSLGRFFLLRRKRLPGFFRQ